MKKNVIIMVLFSLIIITIIGCSDTAEEQDTTVEQKALMTVLYSDATTNDSQINYLNNDGEVIDSINIKAQGIFEIEPLNSSPNNNFALLEQASDNIYTINNQEVHRDSANLHPMIFEQTKNDNRIIVYNSDSEGNINYFTYKYYTDNETQQLRTEGFPLAVTTQDDYLYVYTENLKSSEKGTFSLKVIDLKDFKVLKEIKIPNGGPLNEIKIKNEKMYLPLNKPNDNEAELVVLSLDTYEVLERKNLKFPSPSHMIFNTEEILITFKLEQDKGAISVLDEQNLDKKQEKEFNHPFFKVIEKNNKLFVLNQKGKEGEIKVYDLKNFEEEKNINLEAINNMKVHDFELME